MGYVTTADMSDMQGGSDDDYMESDESEEEEESEDDDEPPALVPVANGQVRPSAISHAITHRPCGNLAGSWKHPVDARLQRQLRGRLKVARRALG